MSKKHATAIPCCPFYRFQILLSIKIPIAAELAEHVDAARDDEKHAPVPAGASNEADDTSATLRADGVDVVLDSASEDVEASPALRRCTRGAKPMNPHATGD